MTQDDMDMDMHTTMTRTCPRCLRRIALNEPTYLLRSGTLLLWHCQQCWDAANENKAQQHDNVQLTLFD